MTLSSSPRPPQRTAGREAIARAQQRSATRQPSLDLLLPNGQRLSLPAFRALFVSRTSSDQTRSRIADESIAGRAGPIRLRRYLPPDASGGLRTAIMYLHGGGWVAGGLDSHDDLCRHLAEASGLQVIAIDYRLAPEHPFPAAVEDATDAYALIRHRADAWGFDPSRLVVMGEGSGATLAAVAAIHARDLCLPLPLAQVLLYPVVDLGEAAECDPLESATADLAAWFRLHYLRGGGDPLDWRVSPLQTPRLSGVPAAFIAHAGRDRFGRDVLAFERRLRAEGVKTRLHRQPQPLRNNPALGGEAMDIVRAAVRFIKAQAGAGNR
jgi:acetyl esterase